MNALLLLAEGSSGGGQIQEIARSFGVDWTHLIAQIISFGIVCAVLYRYAYQPVLTMLQSRRERIAEGLAGAEKIKQELAAIELERKEILRRTNAQASSLIDEARAAAARVQAEETQKAIAAAEGMLKQTREAAAREHDRMLRELKKEMGRLVVQTTAALIGRSLTMDDQKRLVMQTAAAMDGKPTPEATVAD
jgi:F-type H+-transporting ATPase subunit b